MIIIKNNPVYNINIEHMLWLPCNVYWKKANKTFLGINDKTAEYLNLSSRHDIKGRLLEEIDPDQPSDIILTTNQIDDTVLQNNRSITMLEVGSRNPNYQREIFFSFKTPLITHEGKIEGVFGFSFQLNDLSLHDGKLKHYIQNLLSHFSTNQPITINGEKLTRRQSECLYYLCSGLSYKQIGKRLNISPRTVEDHIRRIKDKFNCLTTEELIDKILKNG